jgi:hypothetical protein
MARRPKAESRTAAEPLVKGAVLEPIRVVQREISLPDGSTATVDVPVYPPFRLEDRAAVPKPLTRVRHRAKARAPRSKASGEV